MKIVRDYIGYQHIEYRNKRLCKLKKLEDFIIKKTKLPDLDQILMVCGNCSDFQYKNLCIDRYEEETLKTL